LATIGREIERCKEIARRFLNFSRTRQGEEETVEVAKLLDDAGALIRAHPANRSAEVSVSASDPALQIKVHPAEIMQVLINLGVNALQAMQGAGTLQLSAEQAGSLPDKPAFRSTRFEASRSLVRLAVTDSGCGIAPENIEKLFQPYFTTKAQGTGLGLAIVAELVDNYGGLIDVQSAPGQGTTFSVFLPQAN
jgi:signal transduction histidine kinase